MGYRVLTRAVCAWYMLCLSFNSGAAAHFTHILIGWKVGEVYDLWAENISDYQTLDFPVQDNGEEDEEDDE